MQNLRAVEGGIEMEKWEVGDPEATARGPGGE